MIDIDFYRTFPHCDAAAVRVFFPFIRNYFFGIVVSTASVAVTVDAAAAALVAFI